MSRSAKAAVRLIVETEIGSWGPDCTIAQAVKQATEEAVQKVRHAFPREDVRIVKIDSVEVTLGWMSTGDPST